MILQLNPPIPVITTKGKALAHFLIDTGIENDIQWVCFIDATGEFWTVRNPNIRAQLNITHGRYNISTFYNPESVALKKEGGYFCTSCNGQNECTCENEEEDEEEKADQLEEIAYLEDVCREQAQNLKDYKGEVEQLNSKLCELKSLIKKLIKDDHIFGNSREIAKSVMNDVTKDDENELPY